MRKLLVGLALIATMSIGAPAAVQAHHGGAVEYHMDKTAGPITGTVTAFAFRFPHPYIEFDVKDASGATQKWTAVMQLTPTRLRAMGWTRESVRPGDTLTVTYSPHRSAATVGFARRVEVNGKLLGEGV